MSISAVTVTAKLGVELLDTAREAFARAFALIAAISAAVALAMAVDVAAIGTNIEQWAAAVRARNISGIVADRSHAVLSCSFQGRSDSRPWEEVDRQDLATRVVQEHRDVVGT